MEKFKMKKQVQIVLFLLGASVLAAQEYKFDIRADHPDGIYRSGEKMEFTAKLLQDGKMPPDKKIHYIIYHNGKEVRRGDASAAEPVKFDTKLDKPGYCMVTLVGKDAQGKVLLQKKGKREQAMVESRGVIADPLNIRQGAPEPDDFDAFWDNERKKLKALPANVKVVPIPNQKAGRCFLTADVGQGFRPVNAILHRPANAKPKSLPIFIFVHGAGVHFPGRHLGWHPPFPKKSVLKYPALFLNLNAHGLPNDQPVSFYQNLSRNELKNYPFQNSSDKNKYYMKGMILRLMRAIDVMTSFPEWDGKNIVVSGGSQGGAQALIAAGIDPRVSFIYADVPAMCDFGANLVGHYPGWPKPYRVNGKGVFMIAQDHNWENNKKGDASIVRNMGYFDAANFAKRIHAEAHLRTGGWDGVCPPTSVFSAYNNIPSKKKSIQFSSQGGHCRGVYENSDQQKIAVFEGNAQVR